MKDKTQGPFAEAAALMHKGFPVLVKNGVQDRAQLERLYPEGITAKQFVTRANERVLTDDGEQGMHGKQGIGSTTERHQGQVAAAIYANCAQLDKHQLDEIIEWVRLYKK
ncbi:hypothetical protein [Pseudomonas syringae]|nr:hypothetical protein [Pseudomonas syringae]ARO45032.1 hypothetical protein [Pseudomonas syringae pv. actinidiae]ARO45125.1 hypothetical protein [Pseudomonas syringae pv. actinidiae]MDU8389145.1 hypothetical protein [Pseudomonas syringae pv. actinidiae]MDU8394535.1 hypothetical protein [Pseudomonas syringae pv. actinidiae]MDU8441618.1 hypothetical protein [Pseudomonas syringae pv. actinidiae]